MNFEYITDAPPEVVSKIEMVIKERFNDGTVKKILLIHPPDIESESFNYTSAKRGAYYNFPPYGLGVLAGMMKKNNFQVQISNLNLEILRKCKKSKSLNDFNFDKIWKNKLLDDIKEFKPDLLGVGCLFTATHNSFIKVCKQIKNIPADWIPGFNKKASLVVGGVHVSQYIEKVLNELPEVDFAFLYESELSFLNFLEIVNKRKKLSELSQIVINTNEETINITNRTRPNEEQINILPDSSLLEVEDFSKLGRVGSFDWAVEKDTLTSTVLSNRGCRASCTFCNVKDIIGKGVRQRTIQSVIDEMKVLYSRYGIKHISWLDDDLLYNEKRAISLFNKMVQQNVNMTWDATNGLIASSCKDEVISAAAESGCVGINIGVESGNPEILREVRKPGSVDTFLKAAEVIRKYESINVRAFLMIGFPNETYKQLMDTVKLAFQMSLDWYSITILKTWENTPIYNTMKKMGFIDESIGEQSKGNYSSGPLGKQKNINENLTLDLDSFLELFRGSNLDKVPSQDKLMDIWFYFNYYVNFYSLFNENRELKLRQQLRNLENISTVIDPDNCFGIYFTGFLQNKVNGCISKSVIDKLKIRLNESRFWVDVFASLELSAGHLEKQEFPQKNRNDFLLASVY